MITAIIVVYKTDPKKLRYILKKIDNKYPLIIIDNSFNYDFSKFKISKKTKIIRSQNIGNGPGNNLGLKYCKTPYAILFDIDVIFKNNFISELIKYTRKIKNFAVLAPNTGQFNTKQEIIEEHFFEAPIMLFNIKKLKKIGFFDEKIFMYFEETDLFTRCKKQNFKVFIITKLMFKHLRASSLSNKSKFNESITNLRQWHYMWSMFYYYKKNFNYFYALRKTLLFLIKDTIKIIYHILTLDEKKFLLRLNRISGLISSIFFLKSYKRIK